jgi:hypothetical protein
MNGRGFGCRRTDLLGIVRSQIGYSTRKMLGSLKAYRKMQREAKISPSNFQWPNEEEAQSA